MGAAHGGDEGLTAELRAGARCGDGMERLDWDREHLDSFSCHQSVSLFQSNAFCLKSYSLFFFPPSRVTR